MCTEPRTRHDPLRAALLPAAVVTLTLGACSTGQRERTYEPAPMPFHGLGRLDSIAASANPLHLNFRDRSATASLRHGPGGCLESLAVTATTAVGDTVSLTFAPRDAFGMALASMRLRRDGGTWELVAGSAWLPLDTLEELGDGPAALDKLLIAPRGEVALQRLDTSSRHPIAIDLRGLDFGGDVHSDFDPAAHCKPCTAPACSPPFPTWRLRDFQPESPRFNLEYDLNVQLGEPLVAILTQGW